MDENISYESIVLTRNETKLLRNTKRGDRIHFSTFGDCLNSLVKMGLIAENLAGFDEQGWPLCDADGDILMDKTYYLTDFGERYLIYLKSVEGEKRRKNVTLLVAVIALVISIASLIWNIRTERWKREQTQALSTPARHCLLSNRYIFN